MNGGKASPRSKDKLSKASMQYVPKKKKQFQEDLKKNPSQHDILTPSSQQFVDIMVNRIVEDLNNSFDINRHKRLKYIDKRLRDEYINTKQKD